MGTGLVTTIAEGTVDIIATSDENNTIFGSGTLTVESLPTFNFTLTEETSGTNFSELTIELDGPPQFDNYTMSFQSSSNGEVVFPLPSGTTYNENEQITIPQAEFNDGSWTFRYNALVFGIHNLTITLNSTEASNSPTQSETLTFNNPNSVSFSAGTNVSNSLTSVNGTVTIVGDPATFTVTAFGGGGVGGETEVTFIIQGFPPLFVAAANGQSNSNTSTFTVPSGTYTYSLSGLFIGSSGNSGSVSASQ